jgi:hypothetical protein
LSFLFFFFFPSYVLSENAHDVFGAVFSVFWFRCVSDVVGAWHRADAEDAAN